MNAYVHAWLDCCSFVVAAKAIRAMLASCLSMLFTITFDLFLSAGITRLPSCFTATTLCFWSQQSLTSWLPGLPAALPPPPPAYNRLPFGLKWPFGKFFVNCFLGPAISFPLVFGSHLLLLPIPFIISFFFLWQLGSSVSSKPLQTPTSLEPSQRTWRTALLATTWFQFQQAPCDNENVQVMLRNGPPSWRYSWLHTFRVLQAQPVLLTELSGWPSVPHAWPIGAQEAGWVRNLVSGLVCEINTSKQQEKWTPGKTESEEMYLFLWW